MQVCLIHNPDAGTDDRSEEHLVARIEECGHQVSLFLKDDNLKHELTTRHFDVVTVAGGDGTIENVVSGLFQVMMNAKIPIAFIPLGTANNIANSFGVNELPNELAEPTQKHLPLKDAKTLTIGKVSSSEFEQVFLESVGFGLLTQLMIEGKRDDLKQQAQPLDQRGEIKFWVGILESLLKTFEAQQCHLYIDGHNYSGQHLAVEVMNISRMGPGLVLAPEANPADDLFEVVIINAMERSVIADFLGAIIRGENPPSPFLRVTGKTIELRCLARNVHIDDRLLMLKKPFLGDDTVTERTFKIQASKGQLSVLT